MMGFSKNAVLLFYDIFNYHSERTLHCCFCQFIWVVYSKNPFHDSMYCTHCDSDSTAVDMYSKAMICNPMQVILQGFQCSSYYYFFIYLIFNTITCYSILPDKLAFILLLCSFQTGPRYVPLLVESGVMKSVQEICITPFNGVNELAQKLINTVKDFQSSRKWIFSSAFKQSE